MGHCFISFKMEDMPVCLHIDGNGPVEGKREGAGERFLGERGVRGSGSAKDCPWM